MWFLSDFISVCQICDLFFDPMFVEYIRALASGPRSLFVHSTHDISGEWPVYEQVDAMHTAGTGVTRSTNNPSTSISRLLFINPEKVTEGSVRPGVSLCLCF